MIKDEIRKRLFELQDIKFKEFSAGIIPEEGGGNDRMIGVRTPDLRKYAKELAKRKDIEDFLSDLPHDYFEEDQLHAFIISGMKDWDSLMEHLERFLPYVNNWATCDQMTPKAFSKHHKDLLPYINRWMASGEEFIVRFGIKQLMDHFLDDDFNIRYPKQVAKIRSDKYYINMMIAWYFATALSKQYDAIIPFIEQKKLDTWTHNKSIQKAIESYRITSEQKEYLRTLKIKK